MTKRSPKVLAGKARDTHHRKTDTKAAAKRVGHNHPKTAPKVAAQKASHTHRKTAPKVAIEKTRGAFHKTTRNYRDIALLKCPIRCAPLPKRAWPKHASFTSDPRMLSMPS